MSSCELTVRTGLPSTVLTLLDHQDRPVARGVGSLDAEGLDPGVYRVQVEAGDDATERLLVLREGRTEEQVDLELPLATPVTRAARHRQDHAPLMTQASASAVVHRGLGSRLVVMTRVVDRVESLPTVDPMSLSVTGLTPAAVEQPPSPTDWLVTDGCAATSIDLDPGTYALVADDAGRRIRQPVQTVGGWTTLVFLPAAPSSPTGPWRPDPRRAVVHLAELGRPFASRDAGSDEAFATEMALEGLRDGAVVLPSEGWEELLVALELAPMLGVYAAHAALARPRPDLDPVEAVWGRLTDLVPEHLDVQALGLALDRARHRWSRSRQDRPSRPATVPPMLRAGYAALLEADLEDPAVLVDGSLAEQVAGRLLADGLWVRWDPEDDTDEVSLDADQLRAAASALRRLTGPDLPQAAPAPSSAVPSAPPSPPPSPPPSYALPPDRAPRGGRLRGLGRVDLSGLARRLRSVARPGRSAEDAAPAAPAPAPAPAPPPVPPVPPSAQTVSRDAARVADALARLDANRDPAEQDPTVADVSRLAGLPVSRVTAVLGDLRDA